MKTWKIDGCSKPPIRPTKRKQNLKHLNLEGRRFLLLNKYCVDVYTVTILKVEDTSKIEVLLWQNGKTYGIDNYKWDNMQ